MPIIHAEKILYSSGELSERTNIPHQSIEQFLATQQEIQAIPLNHTSYIEKKELAVFFERCLAYLQVLPAYYEIPDELTQATAPWARTLVQMYHEPFAYGTSLAPSQGQFLKEFVSNVQPRTIVEIGSFIGISTIWMASGLEQVGGSGVLHAIDFFTEMMPCFPYRCGYIADPLQFAQNAAATAQLSQRIKFYQMNSYDVGQHFEELINAPIDLLFIDGDHSIQGCLHDFALFAPYVPMAGYIILHDIYPEHCGYDGPRYLLDHVIKKAPDFDVIELKTVPYNFGIAILQKKAKRSIARYSRGHLRLEIIRLKAHLQKTRVWQSLKTTPIGKWIKGAWRSLTERAL